MTARIALILSVLSLMVGLSAPAIAGVLITSSGIKDGTIMKKDLNASTIKALKGSKGFDGLDGVNGIDGLPGAVGAPGAAGVPGSIGPAGGFNPAKVTYHESRMYAVAPYDIDGTAVYCPSGSKVIAGGFFSSITDVAASAPTTGGTGWFVLVHNETGITVEITAWAVCASA